MTHITNYTEAWRSRAGHGLAWQRKVRSSKVRHGAARLGLVRRSMFAGGISPALRSIFTNYTQGVAWHGQARLGGARQGRARRGLAWLGKVSREKSLLYIQSSQIILGARHGFARLGNAGPGKAWQGHRASKPCALCVKSDLHGEKGKN